MRVLVTWGSKRGGTEGIAHVLADALRQEGYLAVVAPAEVARANGFDAVLVGGALYANGWHAAARRFVTRNVKGLRRVPVWFFSSGPLDDSADWKDIAPTKQVRALMDRVGARGHRTFGGCLAPDARGFPANVMARNHAGDWRNPERVRAWAREIARDLPFARPGVVIAQPGRAVARVFSHGFAGWALCAAVVALALRLASTGTALVIHALSAPVIFALVSRHYFRARGAREPLPTAMAFAGIFAALDLLAAAVLARLRLAPVGSVSAMLLPAVLILTVAWAVGKLGLITPWQERRPQSSSPA